MTPAAALLGLSLGLMALRWYQPLAARPPGTPLRQIVVPFRAKVRLQRANVYAMTAILLLGSTGRWIALPFELLAIAAAMGLLLLPIRYTLTDQAIALAHTSPRAWSQFTDVVAQPGRVIVQTRDGRDAFPVWLPAEVPNDLFVAQLTRLIAGAAGPAVAAPAKN